MREAPLGLTPCPEHLLLLAALGAGPLGGRRETAARLLREPLEAERLLALAHRHAAIPLLAKLLSDLPIASEHRDWIRAIRDQASWLGRRDLILVGELLTARGLLAREGIESLPHKGPVLAQQLYGEIGLRPSADLDLIVRRADVPGAFAVLEKGGYSCTVPVPYSRLGRYVESQCEIGFLAPASGEKIELHWAIAPRFFSVPLPVEDLFEETRELQLGGRTVPVLKEETLFTVLCVHGAWHLWERASWIGDLAALLTHLPETWSWARVLRGAQEKGIGRIHRLGARLASRLTEETVTGPILHELGDRGDDASLEREVWERLFIPDRPTPRGTELASFHLRARERWRDRCRYVLRAAFLPGISDLSEGSGSASPVTRPFRLLRRYFPPNASPNF